MDKNILALEPKNVWKHFNSLLQIPRPSKHEARVIEFMKNFGESLGLATYVDKVGNVIISKPATPGMENRKGIILQGHLDMVPQKNSHVKHDFTTDPIDAYIDGEWLTANDTTLGADNGIGAAAAMAVLESKTLKHGPVECLFTIDEETGMTGAFELEPNVLKGSIFLNLDSEDEGELYIGCAGGIDTKVIFNFAWEPAPKSGYSAHKISVTGMKGGHSGLDIILKRGNANLLMNSILTEGVAKHGVLVASLNGGSLRNAIPREAFATVLVPAGKEAHFAAFATEFAANYVKTIAQEEIGLKVDFAACEMPNQIVNTEALKKFQKAIAACPNGVIKMIDDMPEVVETSSNLAIITTHANGSFEVNGLQRSSVDSAKLALINDIRKVFEAAGAQVENQGGYPGWKPNTKSEILTLMKKVYADNWGKTPEIKVIHAGLECGILGDKYPNWDMISFGPTIRFPHSPDEKVKIDTVGMFYNFLVKTLENAPLANNA